MTAASNNDGRQIKGGNGHEETVSNNNDNSNTLRCIMESIMRISLAGFGGALVGLSLSRRPHARLPRRIDSNLPITWAMACGSFCGLIEISRWSSPTSLITSSKSIRTVGDYTLGGAAAGAAFRGMQVAQKRSSRPPSLVSGVVSGMMLGFLAGVVQYAADVGEELLEQEQQRRWQEQGLDEPEPPQAPTPPPGRATSE